MDGFEELLRAWGDALVCRQEGIQRSSRTHALTRARDFAPGRDYLRAIIGRDGSSRREHMGAVMGQSRAVPLWAVDPVPCHGSRSGPARDYSGLPDHLKRVNDAVRALGRVDARAANALRQQYAGRGTQADMAARLGLTRRQFERDLERGRAQLRHTLHPPLTCAVEAG